MADDYTLTTEQALGDEIARVRHGQDVTASDLANRLMRWLAEHDAKVRAEEREKPDREPSEAEVTYVARAIATAAPDVEWEDLSEIEKGWYLRDARAALLAAQEVRRG